ncbi:pentapeptide repeat-containing protein [Sorangium sp. So ce406]|uniref:pentapeptide repeat-containing protein n=1 Tax=Sorangium sp. So ce406 TaxID=3133311 RepID=UPI003F5BC00E
MVRLSLMVTIGMLLGGFWGESPPLSRGLEAILPGSFPGSNFPFPRTCGEFMVKIECDSGVVHELQYDSLRGINLAGLDLHRAKLDGADLEGSVLDGATLRAAALEGARLLRCSLVEARLQGCWAKDADFRKAVLTKAKLDAADLTGADLREADLHLALVWGARFSGARLDGADMRCLQLEAAKLRGATCDLKTRWPEGFDPEAHGVLVVVNN